MRLGRTIMPALLLASTLALSPFLTAASRAPNTRGNRSRNAVSSTARRRLSSARSAKTARKNHRPNAYQRLAKMQIDPERVQNIQRALVGAGVYHGAPSGQWDAETRDAMSRYQAQNGFGVTGLPDAKSLMKLGLGPHPLPASLDKTRAANTPPNAGAGPGGEESPSGALAPPSAPGPSPVPGEQAPPER